MDHTSGVYRWTRSSHARLSPFLARATRSVAGRSSLIGLPPLSDACFGTGISQQSKVEEGASHQATSVSSYPAGGWVTGGSVMTWTGRPPDQRQIVERHASPPLADVWVCRTQIGRPGLRRGQLPQQPPRRGREHAHRPGRATAGRHESAREQRRRGRWDRGPGGGSGQGRHRPDRRWRGRAASGRDHDGEDQRLPPVSYPAARKLRR